MCIARVLPAASMAEVHTRFILLLIGELDKRYQPGHNTAQYLEPVKPAS
jgi:hypothetical protein